jgi:hypothetical protein
MIKSILAFWCFKLFLFFYNCCTQLDDEFAIGAIEAIVDNLRATRKREAFQANFRLAVANKKSIQSK